MAPWSPAQMPDLTGKVVVVTGGNAGLGLAAARELAAHNAHVFITSRSLDRGSRAAANIMQQTKGAKVDVLQLDLTSFDSIKAAASEFLAKDLPLHVLVCNAGVFLPPHSKTDQGFEVMVGTGYFGHVLLVQLLLGKLKESAPSRIVIVSGSAEATANIKWDDLGLEKTSASGLPEAGQLNALRILAAFELNKRLAGTGVDVFSCHPGIASTEVFGNMDKTKVWLRVMAAVTPLIAQAPAKGAISMLYAATAPELAGKGGSYFGPNSFNMCNASQRTPGNKYIKDPANWARAYDDTLQILRAKGGLTP